MFAIKVLVWILEFLFFGGLMGSAVVVLLTGIDDVREVMGDKKEDLRAHLLPIASPREHTA